LLVTLVLPQVSPSMTGANVTAIHAQEGEMLAPGARLVDISVDFSGGVAHDCPPVSGYRVALRERLWLRRLLIADGETVAAGATLAVFTAEPDSPLDEPAARAARVTLAGMVSQPDWWDEPQP
jgi:pyruvate/2-oxoglutarate dehydrogenase complex dihydrolipoamide acyltransferase (E2) component